MHLVEEHYYTINKVFLKLLGIWPHDRSRFISFQRLLIIILIVTYIGMQFSLFFTMEYSKSLFIVIISRNFPFVTTIIKYCSFILQAKSIQNLHYRIQEDWRIIQNKLESKIILKHAHYSQICAITLFLCVDFIVLTGIIVQFLPNILDVVLPLNESRPRKLVVMAEYFVSEDKYFLTKVLHECLVITIGALIIFTTLSQVLVFSCHSFGMFKITSHRIENFIDDSILHIPSPEKEYAFYKRIMHAVIAHRRAMEFCNIFVSAFNIPYCIIIIMGVISISINLYGFVEAATMSKSMENAVMHLILAFGHLIFIFVMYYVGQMIIDYNNELFKLLYCTSWYLMPLSSQKLILFLMQKTGKDFHLTLGFIFVVKMESYATLVNTALSYVTVLYSSAN